jgi:hypothetical protein
MPAMVEPTRAYRRIRPVKLFSSWGAIVVPYPVFWGGGRGIAPEGREARRRTDAAPISNTRRAPDPIFDLD